MDDDFGIEWKCGKCGKEYTTDGLLKLKKIPAVPKDPDPKKNYGYTSVCTCGYIFHRDKWHLRETVKFVYRKKKVVIDVSTVFLELNHFGYWYETMLFNGKGNELELDLGYQKRYVTKEEAEKNHKKIMKQLKNKEFKVVKAHPKTFDIQFKEDKNE